MKTLGLMSLFAVTALAGCSTSRGPFSEVHLPADAPSVQAVRDSPESFRGEEVRWGGTIVEVFNDPAGTCLEMVSTDLEQGGRPKNIDRSHGRFISCIDQFLDPAIYAEGREVTVIGTVTGSRMGNIDGLRYRYPVVSIERARLWELDDAWAYYGQPWGPYGTYWW